MEQKAIDLALKGGAPITCATCKFYHERNGFCGETACGGPGAGRDFPVYNGPVPRDKFVDRCLICGTENISSLIVGLPTKFSLCEKHKNVYKHVGANRGMIKHNVIVIDIPK